MGVDTIWEGPNVTTATMKSEAEPYKEVSVTTLKLPKTNSVGKCSVHSATAFDSLRRESASDLDKESTSRTPTLSPNLKSDKHIQGQQSLVQGSSRRENSPE